MLVNKKIVERMVDYGALTEKDVVLEIGCGTGNLTTELLRRCRVCGIEKDYRLFEFLCRKFSREIEIGKLNLIRGDALKVDFPFFTKLISNIPYEISSPLMFKLFKHKFDFAVIMLQREFAERLCREDSRLGVIAKSYCKARILELVGKENFKPKPSVESAIVKIIPEPAVEVKDREIFERFVTFAFSMRRKRLEKIVKEFNRRFGFSLKLKPELAEKRPEEIGAFNFARIADDLRAS